LQFHPSIFILIRKWTLQGGVDIGYVKETTIYFVGVIGCPRHDEVGVQHVPVATDTIPPPPPPGAAAAAAIGVADNSDPVTIVATIEKDTTATMADPTELPLLVAPSQFVEQV
jgi:hypothetical protein